VKTEEVILTYATCELRAVHMCRVKMAVRSRFSFVDVRVFPVISGSVEEEKVGREGRKIGREKEERKRGGGRGGGRGGRRGRVGGLCRKERKRKLTSFPGFNFGQHRN